MARGKPKRNVPTVIPAALARTQLGALLRRLKKSRRGFLITKSGKPAGVLLSPEDYEDIMEEMDPAFRKSLEVATKEYREGRTVTLAQLVERHVTRSRAS